MHPTLRGRNEYGGVPEPALTGPLHQPRRHKGNGTGGGCHQTTQRGASPDSFREPPGPSVASRQIGPARGWRVSSFSFAKLFFYLSPTLPVCCRGERGKEKRRKREENHSVSLPVGNGPASPERAEQAPGTAKPPAASSPPPAPAGACQPPGPAPLRSPAEKGGRTPSAPPQQRGMTPLRSPEQGAGGRAGR